MTTWPFPFAADAARASSPIAGRIRVVEGRFKNDVGWWPWRSVSDFAAIGYVLTGRERELTARFDAYASGGRTMVRTFGNIGGNLGPVDHRTPGYWDALDRTVALANTRGLYVELNCYGAKEFIADDQEYRTLTRQYAEYAKARPGVLIRLANEPYQNGWTNADDPRLLDLAEIVASVLGHRDFAIGDPADEDASILKTTAEHCNIALLHPSRTEDPANRYRRWVDHLKEGADLKSQLRAGVALVFDEPMGAGVRVLGKRDDDPDALLAAMVVAEFCGCGYTYHWIPEENAFPADRLPGMYDFAAFASKIPISPDWHFSNSTPVEGITWTGLPGKTRNLIRGGQAWSIAYGEADWDSRVWEPGFSATDIHAGPRVRVTTLNV